MPAATDEMAAGISHARERTMDYKKMIAGAGILRSEQVAARLRQELVKRLGAAYNAMTLDQLVGVARDILIEYEPIFARMLTDVELASWVVGVSTSANKLPKWVMDSVGIFYPPTSHFQPPPIQIPPDAFDPEPVLVFPRVQNAIEDLETRNIVTRPVFDQMEEEFQKQAFTVAKEQSESAISKIRDSLVEEIDQGTSLRGFRERMKDGLESSFIGPAHLENVYRTNTLTAYANGQETIHQNPVVQNVFPYAAYYAIHDSRVREEHLMLESLGLDGTNIYRADDPMWQIFTPPWDFNCRCSKRFLTIRQAAKAGVKEAKEWLDTGEPPGLPEWRIHAIPFGQPESGYVGAVRLGLLLPKRLGKGRPYGTAPVGGVEIAGRYFEPGQIIPRSQFEIDSAVQEYRAAVQAFFPGMRMSWSPYDGPRGGKGWKDDTSGEVRYQKDKPDERESAVDAVRKNVVEYGASHWLKQYGDAEKGFRKWVHMRNEDNPEPVNLYDAVIYKQPEQLIADVTRALYEDDPNDAIATIYDMNTVTDDDIAMMRRVIYDATQRKLEKMKLPPVVTVYRGDDRQPGKKEVTRVTLKRSTAEFFAKQRKGRVYAYEVPIEEVLGTSLLQIGTFDEDELIVPAASLIPANIESGKDAFYRSHVMTMVNNTLDDFDDSPILRFSPQTKSKYKNAMKFVLERMPEKSLEVVSKRLRKLSFYHTTHGITMKLGPELAKKGTICGAYNVDNGELHLDGDATSTAEPERARAEHTYAHEMGHVVDSTTLRPGEKIFKHYTHHADKIIADNNSPPGTEIHASRLVQWVAAWKEEIRDVPDVSISTYAMSDPSEGFAEFHRMMIFDPDYAKRYLPKCYEFFTERLGYSAKKKIPQVAIA